MPNLDFYALDDDWVAVLSTVFDMGLFRVFESDSEPGRGLQEFQTVAEVPVGPRGRFLQLFVLGSGPEPVHSRVDFLPGVSEHGTFRYTCEGWGLIQLQYGGRFRDELRWSHTNHNSEKRARAWAASIAHLGDPAEWNWPAVAGASGKLNRKVRGMAVSKISSRPVLPHAARFIANTGLQYEYGTGIHANPAAGMIPR